MKMKKLLSIMLVVMMLATMVTALPVLAEGETVYTSANGWTLNGSEEQQDGSLAIKAGGSTPTVFTPTLTTGKKYSIAFEVTGLTSGGSDGWAYPFRMKVSAGGTDVDGALQYRMAGRWEAGSNTTYGTNGTMEVIIDTVTGEWETYALGNLAKSGTFADPSDFALKFYRWSDACQAYISNVTVTDITPSIYNSANGWSKGTDAIEQGTSLVLGKQDSVFTPALTSGNQYEITFDVDVPDTIVGGSWSKPAQISLYAGGTTQTNVMSYYLSGAWMNGSKATTYGNTGDGTMKVTIDTATGAWSIDAPGTGTLLTGTFTAPVTGFAIGLHCEQWVDPATYPVSVSNMTVTDITSQTTPEPTVEPEINIIYTPENGWMKGGAKEQQDGSLKIAKGSANAAAFTPTLEAGKVYEITYDVSGLTTVSGSWKKPFTMSLSAGGQTETNVLTYRMAGAWRDATTDQGYADGSNGQNKIIIDTVSGEWVAYALGSEATYSGFTSHANGTSKTYHAFSDTSDFTLRFYSYDTSDDFDTPYISNVTVTEFVPSGYTNEKPTVRNYQIEHESTAVDTPNGLLDFDITIDFKADPRKQEDITVFAGVYDTNGSLISLGKTDHFLCAANPSVSVNVSMEEPYAADNTLKVFVWKGDGSMRPLLSPIHPTEPASFKVLAIGNSFSDDATAYLYQIAKDYGILDVVIGNLYIGGCSLEMHWNNANSNAASYTYYKNTDGAFVAHSSTSILTALTDEDWDIIVMQQASGKSGLPNTYDPYLTNLKGYVNAHKTNPNAKLAWHMTWAYQGDSTHSDFANYESDQMTMYQAITGAVNSKIVPDSDFTYIIPSGTAIQNMRAGSVGDTLTRDGYHLSIPLGRYIAGLTWFKTLTGYSLDAIDYAPSAEVTSYRDEINEAVNHACEHPFQVTTHTVE